LKGQVLNSGLASTTFHFCPFGKLFFYLTHLGQPESRADAGRVNDDIYRRLFERQALELTKGLVAWETKRQGLSSGVLSFARSVAFIVCFVVKCLRV